MKKVVQFAYRLHLLLPHKIVHGRFRIFQGTRLETVRMQLLSKSSALS